MGSGGTGHVGGHVTVSGSAKDASGNSRALSSPTAWTNPDWLRVLGNAAEAETATAIPISGKVRASVPPAASIKARAPGGILVPPNTTTNRFPASAVCAGEDCGNPPSTSSPTRRDTHPTTTARMALATPGVLRLYGTLMPCGGTSEDAAGDRPRSEVRGIFQPDRWKIGREALFRCVSSHYSMHRGARNESSPDSRRGSSSILTLIFPAC